MTEDNAMIRSMRADLMALVDRVVKLESKQTRTTWLVDEDKPEPCGCEESVRLRKVLGKVRNAVDGDDLTAVRACALIEQLLKKEGL